MSPPKRRANKGTDILVEDAPSDIAPDLDCSEFVCTVFETRFRDAEITAIDGEELTDVTRIKDGVLKIAEAALRAKARATVLEASSCPGNCHCHVSEQEKKTNKTWSPWVDAEISAPFSESDCLRLRLGLRETIRVRHHGSEIRNVPMAGRRSAKSGVSILRADRERWLGLLHRAPRGRLHAPERAIRSDCFR
jgi:hypothetical protein